MSRPVIAIDGPAGSGKSTLARRLAVTLDLPYLNTGLMYRALTLEALHTGLDLDDGPDLGALARRMRFELNSMVRPPELLIDGAEPDTDLASPSVESSVSHVARHLEVRAVLRAEQRRLAAHGGVVEGRDIGTVVLPGADAKIFLEAAQSERVARRTQERSGRPEHTGAALAARDAMDARTNPLEPAPDAVPIDTTRLDADGVFEAALAIVRDALERRRG